MHSDNRLPNDTQSDEDTQDKDILIGNDNIVPDDGEEPIGPFSKDKVIHPTLWV